MTGPAILNTLRAAGLSLEVTEGRAIKVRPSNRLTDELRGLIRAHKSELADWLVAANDAAAAEVAAWIDRCRVVGHEVINPATLAKFAAASEELDRKIGIAGAPDVPDRWTWPRDPSLDAAMNGSELELFGHRLVRFLAFDLDGCTADELAEKLVRRDREGDRRIACAECIHARTRPCPGGHPLPPSTLHHCAKASSGE